MPSGLRRLVVLAVLSAALAVPSAAAAVTSTGGVAPPLASPSGEPSGGSKPIAPLPPKGDDGEDRGGNDHEDVPSNYLRLYRAAAKAYGLNWRTLAAIGKNESDHGRAKLPGVDSGLNYANCCAGPMQICKVSSCGNTWGAYRVDGNRDGKISVYSPADAIYGAADLVSDLKRMFGPRPKLLLAAYNAGPGNVMRYDGVPPFKETKAYVKRGLAYIEYLRG